jgi:hypothetical protein
VLVAEPIAGSSAAGEEAGVFLEAGMNELRSTTWGGKAPFDSATVPACSNGRARTLDHALRLSRHAGCHTQRWSPSGEPSHIQEESAMNRSISLSLTLAVALASQLALGGCTKKEDVNTVPTADTGASSAMSSSSTPMDSISSASAVAGSGADAAASAASQ